MLSMVSANERCYYVTPSPIDQAHTQNDPWFENTYIAALQGFMYNFFFSIFRQSLSQYKYYQYSCAPL